MHKVDSSEDAVATLLKAMENDHCAMPDSDILFQTPNGATAKSNLEWEFVVNPVAGTAVQQERCVPSALHGPRASQLHSPRPTSPPSLNRAERLTTLDHVSAPRTLLKSQRSTTLTALRSRPPLGPIHRYAERDGLRETNPEWCRRATPLGALMETMEERCNRLLRKDNHSELIMEELVGGRLYTGSVLATRHACRRHTSRRHTSRLHTSRRHASRLHTSRRHASRRHASRLHTSRRHASRTVGEHRHASRSARRPMYAKYNAVLRSKSKVPFLVSEWKRLCIENNYVTTIHAINSCVIKLSKLTKACKVWRGIKDAMLPQEFWVPNELGVRGGIEYAGRMPCTCYAHAHAHAHAMHMPYTCTCPLLNELGVRGGIEYAGRMPLPTPRPLPCLELVSSWLRTRTAAYNLPRVPARAHVTRVPGRRCTSLHAHAPCASMGVHRYGFSSTTTEKEQAIYYANVGAKVGDAMTIFEMRMGMVDRGADLTWLSQVRGHVHGMCMACAWHVHGSHRGGRACTYPHIPLSPSE